MLKLTIFVLAVLAANCLQLHTQAKVYKFYESGISYPATVRLQDGNLFIEQCPQCSVQFLKDVQERTFTLGKSTCPEETECQNTDHNLAFISLHNSAYYYQNDEGVIFIYDKQRDIIGRLNPAQE